MDEDVIGVLLGPLFEEHELIYPYYRLIEAGYTVLRIGVNGQDSFTGKHGVPAEADCQADAVQAADLAGIHIPGGYAPDHMRRDPAAVALVRELDRAGKPVAAICHGAWLLASAEIVRDRRLTCFHAIKDDLIHAGADYEDAVTVVDGNLVTARCPDDLPAYMEALLGRLLAPQSAIHHHASSGQASDRQVPVGG